MTRNAAHLNDLLAARDAKVYALRVMASAALAPQWTDSTTPRTERPVRFRRVAIRKRDAWGTGWNHYSKSETFRYGY